MYRGIFIQLKIMNYNIKKISIADSVHDFGKELIESFIDSNNDNNQSYRDNMEEQLLNDITGFNEYDHVDFNNLRNKIEHTAAGIEGKISFAVKVDDINNPTILNFISLIVRSHSHNRLLTADVNNIPQNTLCSINQDNSSDGIFYSLTNSTIYDRGYDIVPEENCLLPFNNTARLSKNDNNLFGLEYIETGYDDVLLQYEYLQNSNIPSNKITIYKDRFIQLQSAEEGKFLTLFKRIIEEFKKVNKRQRTNVRGGGKRGRSNDNDISLLQLLIHLQNTYKINIMKMYNKPDRYLDEQSIEEIIKGADHSNMIKILLDFKRAGDQLQVKTSQDLNSVFISNDRLAIAYAYEIGVPSIKTSHSTNLDGTKGKKLCFYGFKKTEIINAIDDVSYYQKIHNNLVQNLLMYHRLLQNFKTKFTRFFNNTEERQLLYIIVSYESILTYINQYIRMNPVTRANHHNVLDYYRLQYDYIFDYSLCVCKMMKILIYDSIIIENILNQINILNENFNNIIRTQPVGGTLFQTLNEKINEILESSYYKNASFINEFHFKNGEINNFIDYIFNILNKIKDEEVIANIQSKITEINIFVEKLYTIFMNNETSSSTSNKVLDIYIEILSIWRNSSQKASIKVNHIRNIIAEKDYEIPFVRDSEVRSGIGKIPKLISQLEDYTTPELIYTYNYMLNTYTTGGRSIIGKTDNTLKYISTMKKMSKMSKLSYTPNMSYSESKHINTISKYNNPKISTHRDLLKDAIHNQYFYEEEKLDKFYKILLLFIAEQYLDERGFFISFKDSFHKGKFATSPMSTSPMSTSPMSTSPMKTSPMKTSPMKTSSKTSIRSLNTTSKIEAYTDATGGNKTNTPKNKANNTKKTTVRKRRVVKNKKSIDTGFFEYLSNTLSNIFGTNDKKK